MPVTPHLTRRLPLLLAALLLTLLSVATARADGPETIPGEWGPATSGATRYDTDDAGAGLHNLFAWRETEALTAQPAETCEDIEFTDVDDEQVALVVTDADLIPESDASQLCIYFDARWSSFSAWALGARSIGDFRRIKRQMQPLLETAGIDPCRVAFWTAFDRQLRRQITLPDRYDAGRPCPVEVKTYGPVAGQRVREIEDTIALSADKAASLFGWRLTWPVRVHVYDTLDSFVTGNREEGGDEGASRSDLEDVPGITGAPLANGGFGQLINVEDLADSSDLRRVVAHEYAHVVQAGVLGDPDVLPFFAIEGSAEYFASLIAGAEQPGLARRFRNAISEERSNQALPLRELIRPTTVGQFDASYARGYAAMRYLAAEWGPDSFVRLYKENIGGTPERFLEAMNRLTGKSLDAFDAELRRYLLAEGAKAATIGRASFTANSRLLDIVTVRRGVDRRITGAEQFTRSDSAAIVVFTWECLSSPLRGEVRMIAPGGRPFVTFSGSNGAGCGEGAAVELALDRAFGAGIPRSLPGIWTAEVYADSVLQGSVTFVVE